MAQVYVKYLDFAQTGSGHTGSETDMFSWADATAFISVLTLSDGIVFRCTGTNLSLISNANAFSVSSKSFSLLHEITFESYQPRTRGIPVIGGGLTAGTAFIHVDSCVRPKFKWKGIKVEYAPSTNTPFLLINACSFSETSFASSALRSNGVLCAVVKFTACTLTNILNVCGNTLVVPDSGVDGTIFFEISNGQVVTISSVGNIAESDKVFTTFSVGNLATLNRYGNVYKGSDAHLSIAGTDNDLGLEIYSGINNLTYNGTHSVITYADFRAQSLSIFNRYNLSNVTTLFGSTVFNLCADDINQKTRSYLSDGLCDSGAFEKLGDFQDIYSYVNLFTSGSTGDGSWERPFSFQELVIDLQRNTPIFDLYQYNILGANTNDIVTMTTDLELKGCGSVLCRGHQTDLRGLPLLIFNAPNQQLRTNFDLVLGMTNTAALTFDRMQFEWMQGGPFVTPVTNAPFAQVNCRNCILRSNVGCTNEFFLFDFVPGFNPMLNVAGCSIVQQHTFAGEPIKHLG